MKSFRILLASVLLHTCVEASGQVLTTLHGFSGYDGSAPEAGLVQGVDGYFYGTTSAGGTNKFGGGTVYKINSSGSLTVLHDFLNQHGFFNSDGSMPSFGSLIQASDGYFYGTTHYGGTNNEGTVYKVNSTGSLTNLYQFVDQPDSNGGYFPWGGLVQGSDGDFYGTTSFGGTNGLGTVFKLTSAGSLTTLYQFSDGPYPLASLVEGYDGYFYGTTEYGGTNSMGTVFKISSTGSFTYLYQFGGIPDDGNTPQSALVQGGDGFLYGTTAFGGSTNCLGEGCGTVFKINSAGSLTYLRRFPDFTQPGGAEPSGLVQGSDGYFYGTTWSGGSNVWGTVFKISSAGTLTVLYNFSGGSDGGNPRTGLIQGGDGAFYGTTFSGGGDGGGTVFRISVPLNSPVDQITELEYFSIFDTANVAVLIPSVAGERYQLEYSDSLSPPNWLNTGGSVTSIGGPLTLIDVPQTLSPQRFYRAVITP